MKPLHDRARIVAPRRGDIDTLIETLDTEPPSPHRTAATVRTPRGPLDVIIQEDEPPTTHKYAAHARTQAAEQPCTCCGEPIEAPHLAIEGDGPICHPCATAIIDDWVRALNVATKLGLDRDLWSARTALPNWRVWRWKYGMPTALQRGTTSPIHLPVHESLVAEYGPQLRRYPTGHGPIIFVQGTADLDDFIRGCRDAEPTPADGLYNILWGRGDAVDVAWPEPGPDFYFADAVE